MIIFSRLVCVRTGTLYSAEPIAHDQQLHNTTAVQCDVPEARPPMHAMIQALNSCLQLSRAFRLALCITTENSLSTGELVTLWL